MGFLSKVKHLLRREKLAVEMTDEMQAHVELQTERNLKAGMSSDEARFAALRQFGNVAVVQQEARAARDWVWLEQFAQDLRFAVRMLWKSPGVTMAAVVTLALGIGVNTALFTVYDIVALRPLASREPDELVDIRGGGGAEPRFSYLDYLDYCAGTEAFSDLVLVGESRVQLPDKVLPQAGSALEPTEGMVSVQAVSGNYFSALGGEIVLGRDFLPAEAGPASGQPVIIISHSFWQSHLQGDPNVLGRVLSALDRRGTGRAGYTIIGVTAPEFVGQSAIPPMGWIPLTATPSPRDDRTRRGLMMIGRMRAGVSAAQAKADLDLIAQRLAKAYPEERSRRATSVELTPGMRLVNFKMSPQFALALSPVLLGFAMVLVMACLNVANLLLARGVARQHEIGVRLVLGAGRGRLVRQLFAENLLLCVLGAGVALLVAVWSLQALKPALMSVLAGEPVARNFVSMVEIGLDRRIVGFGAVLAIVAAFTAGLAPALHSVRRDGLFALKQEGSAFGRNLTPSRLRALLLVAQVAVCLTLLTASGLMTGKLLQARATGAGFSTDGVYQAIPSATDGGAGTMLSTDPLGAVETLRTMPGVASACLVWVMPLAKPGGNGGRMLVAAAGGKPGGMAYNQVSAGFFETLGVPLQRGRSFTLQEEINGTPVVVVSETAARELWPGEEAVGKVLSVEASNLERVMTPGARPAQTFRDYEVIGVSRDFKSNWTGKDETRLLLFPLRAKGVAASILMRLETDSVGVQRGVERMAAAAGVPVKFKEKLATIVDHALYPFRVFSAISLALTVLSLSLATVGLYGVVSFGVNQRVREIGVRMALGATAERVTGLFLRQGMRLVAWGVAFGLAGGVAFMVLLTKALPGAGFAGSWAFRGAVFTTVTLLISGIALVACWLPARRAAKVDPMIALRAE